MRLSAFCGTGAFGAGASGVLCTSDSRHSAGCTPQRCPCVRIPCPVVRNRLAGGWRRIILRQHGGIALLPIGAMRQPSTTLEFRTRGALECRKTMSSHICGSIWLPRVSRRRCPVVVPWGIAMPSREECRRRKSPEHRHWRTTAAVLNADGAGVSRAEWKVERGTKAGNLRDHQVGIIATLPATATFDGVSAYLQVECLEHPEVTTRIVNIVTSKDTAPGLMMWRYQFDDRPPMQRGPYSRLNLKVIGLGDSSSDEFKGLLTARRLRVTLMPARGPQWSFEFDLRGAPQAINAVPCKK